MLAKEQQRDRILGHSYCDYREVGLCYDGNYY